MSGLNDPQSDAERIRLKRLAKLQGSPSQAGPSTSDSQTKIASPAPESDSEDSESEPEPESRPLWNVASIRKTASRKVKQAIRQGVEFPIWVPTQCSPTIQQHIEKLRIPDDGKGFPSLLLHDLGLASHDLLLQDRISNLFSLVPPTKYLCNTSGSGKTRLILEGLCQNWGFYFTARHEPDHLGSSDLTEALAGLENELVGIPQSEMWSTAARNNKTSAQNWFHSILFIRVLVLHEFLLFTKKHGGITDSTKKRWLLFQLAPKSLFKTKKRDLFWRLVCDLRGEGIPPTELERLLIHEIDAVEDILNTTLFIALDEAQQLTKLFLGCFWSVSTPSCPRPVIHPLVRKWLSLIPNIIISGTSLSMRMLLQALHSVMAKFNDSATVTEVGAFGSESELSQQRYIERYLPERLLNSEPGKRLLSRIAFWLRGRHRFTATYIGLLLQNCFQSPHRVLDAFIHRMTQFTPKDAVEITESPYAVTETAISSSAGFIFDGLRTDENLMHTIACSVNQYLFTGEPSLLGGKEAELVVELGFARFRQTEFGVVDEPLALLAAANFFATKTPWSMQNILSSGLLSSSSGGRGFTFKRFGAFLLARAFEKPTPLSSVFTFIGDSKLLHESAQLVAIKTYDDGSSRCMPFSIPPPAGCHYIMGQSPSTELQVLDWLKNPKDTAFCFPMNNVGPDLILFLQLSDSTVLRVLVQFKQINNKTLSASDTNEAMMTTDPRMLFLQHSNDETHQMKCFSGTPQSDQAAESREKKRKRRLRLNTKSRLALHNLAPRSDMAGESSALRVLISFPARPDQETLERCIKDDNSGHPGAVVDLMGIAKHWQAQDALEALSKLAVRKVKQQEIERKAQKREEAEAAAAVNPMSNKCPARSERPARRTNPKRRKVSSELPERRTNPKRGKASEGTTTLTWGR